MWFNLNNNFGKSNKDIISFFIIQLINQMNLSFKPQQIIFIEHYNIVTLKLQILNFNTKQVIIVLPFAVIAMPLLLYKIGRKSIIHNFYTSAIKLAS